MLDKLAKICYTYSYNRDGQVLWIAESDSETNEELRRATFTYNADKTVATKTYSDPRQTYVPSYEDDPDHSVIGMTLNGRFEDKITKDELGRVGAKVFTMLPSNEELFRKEYRYWMVHKDSDDGASTETVTADMVSQVAEYVNGNETSWYYEYDREGNLCGIEKNNSPLVNYYYD